MHKPTEGKTVGEQSDDLLDECAKFLAHAVRDVMKMRCQGAISTVSEIDAHFPVVLHLKDNRLLQKAYEYTVDPQFPEEGEVGDEPSKAEGSGISRGDGVVTHQGRLKGCSMAPMGHPKCGLSAYSEKENRSSLSRVVP